MPKNTKFYLLHENDSHFLPSVWSMHPLYLAQFLGETTIYGGCKTGKMREKCACRIYSYYM